MAKVYLNQEAIRETTVRLSTPLVDKMLYRTYAGAKRKVPVRTPRLFDDRPTGRLKRSMTKQGPIARSRTVTGRVGSRRPYAMSVHDGSKAHRIAARRARLLSFWWTKHNVRFAGPRVNHPGVRKGNPFLWDPLVEAARRYGFKTRRLPLSVQGI